MEQEEKFYLVKKKAVPEVLLKVVEAKRLLDAEKVNTVQEATEEVGISRSSFYKYKDDILPFHEDSKGKTITVVMQLDDEPGLLSRITKVVSREKANVLTIHQSIPTGGIATLTTSLQLDAGGHATHLIEQLEELTGVHGLKIVGRE